MNIVILGPTASGKTHLSIEISKLLNGIKIINVDSRQFWPLRVLTASPTNDELTAAPHVLFNCKSPSEIMSLGTWCNEIQKIQDPLKIIVGGNGFYINNLRKGILLYDMPIDENIYTLNDLKQLITNIPNTVICDTHVIIDGIKVYENDIYRIQRHVLFIQQFGVTFSNYDQKYKEDMLIIAIIPPLSTLYERIVNRTSSILIAAIEEIRDSVYEPNYKSIIGYTEIQAYLADHMTYNALKDIIILKTYQYAKKQIKFLKKMHIDILLNTHILTDELQKSIYEYVNTK